MTRSLRYLFLLLFLGVAGTAMAQSGAITGTVLDEKKQPIPGAIVEVSQGGLPKGGSPTDEDGKYLIKPLTAGRYEVKISYTSYSPKLIKDVIVSPDRTTSVNANMSLDTRQLGEVEVVAYKIPLIDPFSETKTITAEEIENMPTRNTASVVSTNAGVYQASENGGVQIGGARGDGTAYIIDGIRVYGSRGTNLAQNAVDQVEVLSSGLPAKYGDALGGVVNITTKGISDQIAAGILVEKSVDGYGHNLFNFNLSGPLISKKVDSVTKKPIVGFRVDGDFYYDRDRNPTYYPNIKVKDDVLAQIKDKPLTSVPNQNGVPVFRNSTEFLRADDFEYTKQRANTRVIEGRINGRLDFQLTENLNLTAGGTFNYSKSNSYSRPTSVFSPDAFPIVQQYTGRGYFRITQRFGKAQVAPGEKKPLISNAYYTIQADYQKERQEIEHPDFKRDIFKYAYVGKFNTEYTSFYAPGVDDSTKVLGIRLIADHIPTKVNYERSELNPLLANYTSQYYNELGSTPTSVGQIFAQGGLINGNLPQSTYGLFSNVGTTLTSYSYADVDQFAVDVNASFDFQPAKTRHQIEFGLYYQQQVQRGYSAGGAGSAGGVNLWQYARQLTNRHITLDLANPQFIVGGKVYTRDDVEAGRISPSPFDTIFYNRVDTGSQSTFDINLRKKLGVSNTDYIDIDNYDPSTFSLDMFSADELINSGNPLVSYQGYDYLGKRQKGQVNFNDFFTKKDANGNYTRDIGAYRPTYIAGYVLDKFQFKSINFNVGVRIDRFDANTKTLKDPYSLYEVLNVSNKNTLDPKYGIVTNPLNNEVTPGNIGSDYVVYVDNNAAQTKKIIGYRNGDDWYDYTGKLIEDPTVLKNYSGGRDPQPLLTNPNTRISDSTFNPNSSFTDYKPQVNVMPRISFSFPISDQALFFAHYDVLVQRPSEGVYATPLDYYYLTSNAQSVINNPDLKPQKMFDYEVGFKQALTKQSAVTITGFYKERKDMIQVRPYLYAWPTTYYTYGNRDFSTTKGLTLTYDLRRVGNIRMNVAYTLQFAEGTGSNSGSTARGGIGSGILSNFIQAGLPNMRYVTVLDYDSRHNIVATVDYRYTDNDGPIVAGKHILQNAGINFIFRTRSGEPYTKYAQPLQVGTVIEGGVNGSRQPWHYNLDVKLDKDFKLKLRKEKEGDTRKTALYVNAFVLIQNVLNTKDILPGGLNGYTGSSNDDGYLASPQGQSNTQLQTNPASYIDYYKMAMMNPGVINLPRRINLGIQLSF